MCGEVSLLVEDPHHCRIRTINGVLPRRKDERIRTAFVGTNGLGHIFLLVKCSVAQFWTPTSPVPSETYRSVKSHQR